jgi:hypothetical protein
VNEQESKQFYKAAFAAFPGVAQWAKEHSSDLSLTLAMWTKTLSDIDLSDAIEVIEGWADGSIPEPPIGYKRETFALQVKAIVKQRRYEAAKALQREEEWVKANRAKYQRPAGLVLLSPYLNRIFEKQAEFRNGNITQAELDAQTNAIVEEFANAK